MNGPAEITLAQGDILCQHDCDGIVNSANPALIAGGGVCGAIYRAAGAELEPYTRRFAPLALGEAIASPGFKLRAMIFHTRGPRYHVDPDPPGNLIRALGSAVRLADRHGVSRLAVPALSMGVYGYPPQQAAPLLIKAAHELAATVTSLREIRFVVLGDKLLRIFSDLVQRSGFDPLAK